MLIVCYQRVEIEYGAPGSDDIDSEKQSKEQLNCALKSTTYELKESYSSISDSIRLFRSSASISVLPGEETVSVHATLAIMKGKTCNPIDYEVVYGSALSKADPP